MNSFRSSALHESASEQPAVRSGQSTFFSGESSLHVSAMKCTPHITIILASVFAALRANASGCHVHEKFSVEAIVKLKQEHPEAVVMAHLECKAPVLAVADVKGSTATMLNYAKEHKETKEYIIATEAGILHELQRNCPDVKFYPVPPEVSEGGVGCSCNECEYMKKNTLLKIYNTLRYELPEVTVDESIAKDAVKPIERMLELS